MLSPDQRQFLTQPLRIIQVIGAALVIGVLGFGFVAVMVPKGREPAESAVAKSAALTAFSSGSTVVGTGPATLPWAYVAVLLPKKSPDAVPVISLAAAIAAVLAFVTAFVVSRFIAFQSIAARQRVDPTVLDYSDESIGPIAFLTGVYQTSFIVGAAILEGAAFFNLVVHMTEGKMYSVAAAGLLLAGIVLMIPSRGRLETWVEDRMREHRDTRI